MSENEHFSGIQTSNSNWMDLPQWQWLREAKRQRDREIMLFLSAIVAAFAMFGLLVYVAVCAVSAHRVATLELNTTLRQLHLKNELAIAEMENREPRLQPSESPLPE